MCKNAPQIKFITFSRENIVKDLDRQYQQALEEKSMLMEQLQVKKIRRDVIITLFYIELLNAQNLKKNISLIKEFSDNTLLAKASFLLMEN